MADEQKQTESSTKPTTCLERIQQIDEKYTEQIYSMEIDNNMDLLLYLGEKCYRPICMMIYFVLISIYYLYKKEHLLHILKLIIHIGAVYLIAPILRSAIKRPKPKFKDTVKKQYTFAVNPEPYSMPCAEIMQSSNLAIFLILYLQNFSGVFLILSIMIGKIYYSQYYFFDTIASAILGVVICFSLYYSLMWL